MEGARTKALLLICLCGLALGVLIYNLQARWPVIATLRDGRVVGPAGIAANPHSKDDIHPEDVEGDFKLLYKAILAYRKATGHLPKAGGGLELVRFSDKPGAVKVTASNIISIDAEHSDKYAQGQRNVLIYCFALRAPRPMHKEKPDFPKPGERDAWVYSEDYVRDNTVIYPGGTARSETKGFYIVLWSTGEIERISPDDVRYVGESDGLTMYFPGQAGLPKNTVSGKTWNKLTQDKVPAGLVTNGPNVTVSDKKGKTSKP